MSTLVRHVMTEGPRTLTASMSAADAAGMMANFNVGAIPVLDDQGALAGIVTDRDIVTRVVASTRGSHAGPLTDVATSTTIEVSPDTDLAEASRLMAEHQIRRLPVTEGRRARRHPLPR